MSKTVSLKHIVVVLALFLTKHDALNEETGEAFILLSEDIVNVRRLSVEQEEQRDSCNSVVEKSSSQDKT